ncbi:sensor histidine kinase [Paenibacillus sp. IB182496]|uniref:histidine kinase n=1 Tax=Paenibacillus sabuli TaxID=2772509 RepID=A0A927BTZ5_9BACL|nr:sensor histidine kinase [Paenibacillus sabuli]MBD2845635.1 sensor histidine kinase [Paenibacillus sabuli]
MRLTFRRKLVLSYLALVVLSTALIGIFSYLNATRIVEEQISVTYKQALHQANINIVYRLREVENVSELILMDTRLQEVLKREQQGYSLQQREQMLDDYYALMDVITNLESNRNIFRIRLFVSGDALYAREHNNIFNMRELDEVLRQQQLQQQREMLWKSTYEQEYLPMHRLQVLSLFRSIYDFKSLTSRLGIVAIDVREDTLREVIESVNFSRNGAIYVYNGKQRITSLASSSLASYPEDEMMRQLLTVDRAARMPILNVGGEDYFTIFQPIDYNGWEIAALVPVDEIRGMSDVIGQYTGLIGLLVVAIAILPVILLSNRLTRGLRSLVHHMQEVKQGHYGTLVPVTGNDEISGLQAQYNSMLLRIRELVDTVYRMEIRKQAAELIALESQIKPHFLYNTLDTLKWMGMKIKAERIVLLVDALSKFFRLGLNRGRELTTLVGELNHVQAFMNIQDIRYAGKLNYYCEVDSDVLSVPIMKLILQPIVENAVLHGIQQKEDHAGTVIVRVGIADKQLIFDVIDDGVGMSAEQARVLLQEGRGRGYGAKNVHQRIRLYYGEPYGAECYSRQGIGTLIRIRLPLDVAARHEMDRIKL